MEKDSLVKIVSEKLTTRWSSIEQHRWCLLLSPFLMPHTFRTALIHWLQSLLSPVIFPNSFTPVTFIYLFFLFYSLLNAIYIRFPWSSSGSSSLWLCFHYLPWFPILSHPYHISKPLEIYIFLIVLLCRFGLICLFIFSISHFVSPYLSY